MPDPASIIGTLGVSIQLTKEIIKYVSYFKHAPKDATDLIAEVGAIGHVLDNLRQHLESTASAGSSFERTSVLFYSVHGCHRRLEDIHDTLRDLISHKSLVRFWQRLVWPFERGETQDAVLALHRLTQIFHFALSLDGLSALSLSQYDALEKIQETQSDVKGILEVVRELPSISTYTKALTKTITELVTDRQLTQLLDAIPCLPYNDRHRDLQLTRMGGVGEWLIDVPKFSEWRSGEVDNGTLWCNGAPGAGKTYISSVVIDHLHEFAASQNSIVLFMYFDYKLQSEQTPLKFIQTLLRQLLSSFSKVPPEAEKLYQTVCQNRKDLPGWAELKAIFFDLCDQSREVFIVLDALDECDKEANRGPVVEFINDVKKSKAKLLVTSRPYPADIDELLGLCSQILIEASENDIRAYILDRISRSTQIAKLIDATLKEDIVKSVTLKSQGMFLLPALQMNNILGQTNRSQIKKVLESLPSGLADNILATINRIKAQHTQSNARADLALKVLMWLSTVRRPLTAKELQHAIAVDTETDILEDLTDHDFFVDCCFGLVVIDEMSIIKLVHFSVNEYLEAERETLFPNPDSHLALTCLSYMISHGEHAHEAVDAELSNDIETWRFFKYSSRYYGVHAAKGYNTRVSAKLHYFSGSSSTIGPWRDSLDKQIKEVKWNHDQTWVDAAKHAIKFQHLIHLAAIYGIPKLCLELIAQSSEALISRDLDGNSPLMLAIDNGATNVAELLAQDPITDINAQNLERRTALWFAISRRNMTIVRLLFRLPRQVDINLGSPFRIFCSQCGHDEFEELWKLFTTCPDLDINAADVKKDDKPPWLTLARDFEIEKFQTVLGHPHFDPFKSGIPSKECDDYMSYVKNTDYDYISFGDGMTYVPVILKILESGSRFDLKSEFAIELIWPFVYYAYAPLAPNGHQEHRKVDWMDTWDSGDQEWKQLLKKALVEHGITLRYRDSKRNSFLHYLARVGDSPDGDNDKREMVEFLLKDHHPDIRNDKGKTPLHVATQHGHLAIVNKLINAGADITATTYDGSSILHFAAMSGRVDLFAFFVSWGADIHAQNVYGETVLHSAVDVAQDDMEMLDYLVSLGFDVNAESFLGALPLHYAVFQNLDLVKRLIIHGADPGKNTEARGTPLHDAIYLSNTAFPQELLKHCKHNLNERDSYGIDVLNYLRVCPPQFYVSCNFTSQDGTAKQLSALDVHQLYLKRQSMIRALRLRLDYMISGNETTIRQLASRTGFRLLTLGNAAAAQIMLEYELHPGSKRASVFFRDSYCGGCYVDEEVLYKCKICPLHWLCQKCRTGDRNLEEGDAPQCHGHSFVKVPSDEWKDIPQGKVNIQGQTFREWLKELQKQY